MERSFAPLFALLLALLPSSVRAQQGRTTPPQKLFDWTALTFDPTEYQQRRAKLIAQLAQSGGGVYLAPSAEGTSHGGTFRQLDDFLYFTGTELPHSVLAIDAEHESVTLFVPGVDRRFANPARRNDFPGRRLARDPELVARTGIEDVRVFSALDGALRAWAADGRTIRINPGRGGPLTPPDTDLFDPSNAVQTFWHRTRAAHPALNWRTAFDEVARLRMVKSPAEIAVIRRACEITAAGIVESARAIRDGVTERTLEGELERAFKAGGAQRRAFDSIIKSGPNSLWPWRILAAHYDRRNRKMRDGELVIFDVGCEVAHYTSDVGRTFPVSGRFSPRQREVLAMETAVADAVIAAVRPGVTLAELQRLAAAAIPEDQRRFMQTGLFFGHHIGLAVGDPTLPSAPLAPGMVFTVEPWYYNHQEQIAVFTEDVVLVTDTGAEVLTADLPRTPAALEALVGAAPRVRILSYNVRHGNGLDGTVDLARAAAVINAARPDIVALQEIDLGARRTDGVDQALKLGELTGMHAMFGPFMDFQGGRYGMALLSRHPVEQWTNHRLPDGAEPRSALAARVRIRGTERRLIVAGIHLYASEEERLAQASRLLEIFEPGGEVPVVLVGDFNSRPGTAVMKLLAARWRVLDKSGPRETFPADTPDREIDFVLVPRHGTVHAVSCRVLAESVASDHRPVLAELELRD